MVRIKAIIKKKRSEYSSQTIIKHKKKLTPNEKLTFSVNGANALPRQHNSKETNIVVGIIQRKREHKGIYYIMQSNKHFHTS